MPHGQIVRYAWSLGSFGTFVFVSVFFSRQFQVPGFGNLDGKKHLKNKYIYIYISLELSLFVSSYSLYFQAFQ